MEGSNLEMIPGVASVILHGSPQGGYFFKGYFLLQTEVE